MFDITSLFFKKTTCSFFRSNMSNPWLVDDIEDFWFLNCPECAFKTKEQNDFQKHAVGNHTLSLALFSCDSSESHEAAATNKEEIETEARNFKKMKNFDVKEEPDDCLMTDDPTLEKLCIQILKKMCLIHAI